MFNLLFTNIFKEEDDCTGNLKVQSITEWAYYLERERESVWVFKPQLRKREPLRDSESNG